MNRQRSPRTGHVVLGLQAVDSQPADHTRLVSPVSDPHGGPSRIHSRPLSNPIVTSAEMLGFSGDPYTTQDASRRCEAGAHKDALRGRPFCISSEGGARV
jgi:hypothetical protein